MTPRLNEFIPQKPTTKQAAFLLLPHLDCLYGGSAGGGKSSALLMAALQYVDYSDYSALLLRRTYADLSLPGALMDRAADWLMPTSAKWNEQKKTWTFPSGATLNFGYLESDKDKYRYQSSEFQFCGFDELTQFPERTFTYLFSRLRKSAKSPIPIRMRSASNPGGEGHEWVYERYVAKSKDRSRIFVPAGLDDNPHVNKSEYVKSLAELDDITRQQLLDGLWITDPAGKPFKADWWRGQNRYHADSVETKNLVIGRWLSFDTAMKDEQTSAYTACAVGELLRDYRLVIREMWREKLQFPDLSDAILSMASQYNYDDKLRNVVIEDKASGISAYQTLMRSGPYWLRDKLIPFQPPIMRGAIDAKVARARIAANWCKKDMVLLPHPGNNAEWLNDFESELFGFPDTAYKDQVDCFSQLIIYLENFIAEGWHAKQGAIS